jgi:hypothetical protein
LPFRDCCSKALGRHRDFIQGRCAEAERGPAELPILDRDEVSRLGGQRQNTVDKGAEYRPDQRRKYRDKYLTQDGPHEVGWIISVKYAVTVSKHVSVPSAKSPANLAETASLLLNRRAFH